VQDILAASRLELRPDLVKLREVDATELIEEARAKAIAAGLPAQQLTLEDQTGGARVQADRDLVAHALTNLIANARRHTPEQTPIVLGTRPEGDRVLFFVKDAGQGIAPEELPRLFEPFYRPDQSRARANGGGAGLGLALVRRIAELHGQKPFVQSTVGFGSTFGMTVARA
jgi:signal transduction histidine kinase